MQQDRRYRMLEVDAGSVPPEAAPSTDSHKYRFTKNPWVEFGGLL